MALAAAATLVAATSCSPAPDGGTGRVVAAAGSTSPAVVTLPADPATLGASPRPAAASSPAGLAADSAARLDALFQERRTAVNRDARALDGSGLDRRSADYAARYDELRRRTVAAESLRAARDAQRARAAKLGAAPRSAPPAGSAAMTPGSPAPLPADLTARSRRAPLAVR